MTAEPDTPTDTDPVIRRHEIPADRQWHDLGLTVGARVVHVAAHTDTVALWVQTWPALGARTRQFRAYDTGEPLTGWERLTWRGSAATPDGQVVWHLMERVT